VPAGRPSKYSEAYCNEVVEHMREGASLTSFAAEIGVARSTINEWIDNHPAFSEAVNKGKAKCAAWWEKQGRLGATGQAPVNPTLVIFGLKNMAGDDWRDRKDHNHVSDDGSMTPRVLDASKLSTETMREILAASNDPKPE
jgi:hypothetical protein